MAGHSKYKNIMHRKGRADAQRSKLFSKLSRDITVAAKLGMPDINMNPRLRLAVNNAKAESLPRDVIQRAINKAAGGDVDMMEEVRYEGRGPGGVGIIVEALTDNRNRTSAEVRHAFTRNGGSLGEPGSVAWMFETHGVVVVDGERYGEDDLIVAIDAGASDVVAEDGRLRVLAEPSNLTAVKEALASEGVEVRSVGLETEPKNTVEVAEDEAASLMRMLDALEEQDDVNEVYANYDIPEEVLERIAG